MSQTQMVTLVVAVIALAGIVIFYLRTQRSKRLRERFGPEYNRVLETSGNAARGEARLAQLERRVEKFQIKPLEPRARERFIGSWRAMQAKFVDDPNQVVGEADQLVSEVLAARGYPVADFEQQAADLSVNYPLVIEHYRAGHDIAVRHRQGKASTEELRQALIHYRKLFDELVGEGERAQMRAVGR